MKIGVITHHWVYNFGANLQAFSTYNTLKALGHEVLFIDYRDPELVKLCNTIVPESQASSHEQFVARHLPLTTRVNNLSEFDELVSECKFDVLISGSDSVFRLKSGTNRGDFTFPNPFWIALKNTTKRPPRTGTFSVSAMGHSLIKEYREARPLMKKALDDMSIISVRDDWTADQFRRLKTMNKILFSADPVFLFNESYAKYTDRTDKYFLLSAYKGLLTEKWVLSFRSISNNLGYKVFTLPLPEDECNLPVDEIVRLPVSPIEWYDLICNSSGYVGVRFHPIVVCVLNHVPLISLDTYSNGFLSKWKSKTYDLLRRCHLQRYHINRSRIKGLSPEKAVDLLLRQIESPQGPGVVNRLKLSIKVVIKEILNEGF